jgi:peptide/nickel transport system permease protein
MTDGPRTASPASADPSILGTPRHRRSRLVRSFLRARLAVAGSFVLVTVVLLALAAPALAPYHPEKVDIRARLQPPTWFADVRAAHPLGTDQVGRDVLSRILYGARMSLLVGLATTLLGGVAGTALGLLAGYFGGRLDAIIMRLVDIQLAFPSVLLAVALMSVLGPSVRNVILVLSLATWASFCRIARAQALVVRQKEFITGSVAVGARTPRVLLRHALPNTLSPLIVVASFSVATNIINEASLGFLGVGIPPSVPTWGGMLGEGRDYLRIAWWVATLPGLALMVTVYSVNVIGDWLRDYLDPRLRI